MSKFEINESYKHKLEKQVLKEWLDDKSVHPFVYTNDYNGVLLEYPICKIPNFDDTTWDYDLFTPFDKPVPSYTECVEQYNVYPISIIDAVVIHKGRPRYAIEICHTNPVSKEKIKKLREFGVTDLYEVKADWILNQTCTPKSVQD